MRILFLAHRLPFPPNKGEKIRSYNILANLARRHEVILAAPLDDARDLQWLPELRKSVAQVLVQRIDQPARRLFSLRAMLSGMPITVQHFHSQGLQRQVDELLDRTAVDAVFCSSSPMAEYVFRSRHATASLAGARKLMDLIDIDSHKWLQYAASSPPWTAWLYRYEARALGLYEQRIAREFHQLFVVTEAERNYFPGGTAPANLRAMPNGVDLDGFSPGHVSSLPVNAPTLVFTGVMNYRPNVDGVCWFAREVLPAIQAAVPAVRFMVVGSNPAAAVRRLASRPGVTVTGYVEDVRDYVAAASLCVAPLRIARGVQNKVLEAMAMGKAVVATPEALEGLQAIAGVDIVAARTADEFAATVVALLQDPSRAASVGANARRCVERNYSWNGNLAGLREAGL